jgi:cation transport ATPase
MQLDIADNTLDGANPDKITAPIVVWIAGFLAGPVFGSIWMYRNAGFLGCRSQKQQGRVLLASVLFCAPMLVLIDFIKDSFEKGSIERLGNQILLNIVLVVAIVASGYCYQAQRQLYHLHRTATGRDQMRLPTALLFVIGSWFATAVLLIFFPPLGEAMGGLAYFLN